MIILIVAFSIALMLASCVFGMAVGYGQGYEDHMFERMSKKKKNEYFLKKEIMRTNLPKNDIR